jgi:ASCH domain
MLRSREIKCDRRPARARAPHSSQVNNPSETDGFPHLNARCSNPFRGNGFLGGKKAVRGVFCWFLWAIRYSRHMKIISVRQPWAALIVNGLKDIENRTSRTNYRGALLIQASLRADDITADEIERRFGVRLSDDLPRGGIVGVAEIVDCVRDHPSRWFNNGCWGFLLANARPLPLVEWRGALALRDAPRELLTMLFGSDQKEAVAEATAQFA